MWCFKLEGTTCLLVYYSVSVSILMYPGSILVYDYVHATCQCYCMLHACRCDTYVYLCTCTSHCNDLQN